MGQGPRQVLGQSATGDVGHAPQLQAWALQQRFHQWGVEQGWREQGFRCAATAQGCLAGFQRDLIGFQDAAHQAEAIAVNATAGDGQQPITGLNAAAINQPWLIDNGHTKAGQVVATSWIEARHFSGFAPQQAATALAAAAGDSFHHFGHGGRAELAGGDVVEEKQRLGAAGDHVVGAHRHQINPHPVMAAAVLGEFQLGANAIGASHEQGLFKPGRQAAEAAKAPESAQHFGAMGGLHAGADAFNEMASGFNVNAGALVVHLLRLLPLIPSSRKACPIRLADLGDRCC